MAPVAEPIVPSREGLRLRAEQSGDAPFVRHLVKAVKAEQFAAAALPPAALDALVEQQFRLQASGYAARFPDATSLLIEWRGQAAGRLLVHRAAHQWRIIDIAVLAELRGQGIGTSVMTALAAAARHGNAPALTLTVLVTNEAARRFYRKLGFAEIGANAGTAHIEMRRALAD